MSSEKSSELLEKRRQKMTDLQEANVNLFPNNFKPTHSIQNIRDIISASEPNSSEIKSEFLVSGRIMAANRFGKSTFIRFKDRSGILQAYIRKDQIGAESYQLFRQLDIGDFVGLEGSLFKTKTGEWTLLAKQLHLLCKATRPLPEKFHGLKDPEKRYRQRYLDLIINPDVKEIFLKRNRLIQTMRSFFLERDFLEVETPMMQPIPGGAEATPFVTHHNALDMDLYLRIAPELYLKRLVVGGLERVFEINRNFRNEGVSTQHNPEFTMVEFYQAYATYLDLMDFTQEMFAEIAKAVAGSTTLDYQGHTIDLAGEYQRIDLLTALSKIGGLDPAIINDKKGLIDFASSHGITLTKSSRKGKIITKLFDVLVEPHLIQPTFITGYPVEVSPLSRRNDKRPEMTERFELFIAGREIANGFSELNDPFDQKRRFQQQVEDRKAGDYEAHYMDLDYIEALEYGMPPTAGEGIGIDRLTMLLTNTASIREVILFPHMKRKTLDL